MIYMWVQELCIVCNGIVVTPNLIYGKMSALAVAAADFMIINSV